MEDPQGMRTLLAASAGAVLLTLTIASLSAQAALICKDGYLHYGGSGLYANRLEAEASAIEAWRRVRAGNDSDAFYGTRVVEGRTRGIVSNRSPFR
jgi:hypothetical protein